VELAAKQEMVLEPGSHLLVLAGAVELTHAAPRMTTRGTLLLEVERPLRVIAQETTQLVLLPRLASPELQRAVDAAAAQALTMPRESMELPLEALGPPRAVA
jgi:hypothetical protein